MADLNSMPVSQTAVWKRHASQWARVGPPLKPSPEDGALTLAALGPAIQQAPCLLAILGVTPELVQLPWPQSVELRAYDHSAEMIASLWRKHPSRRSSVAQAGWQQLPVADGSFHAVVGDGSLNALPSLAAYGEVLKELHRTMREGASAVIRCFIRPDRAETLAEVVDAVNAGQVGSFHALKWRIAMCLAAVPGAGVAVRDIRSALDAYFPSRPGLASKTGWPQEVIDTIDAYKDSATCYSFPSLGELRLQCQPYFDIAGVRYGSYELSDRCPMITFQRLGRNRNGE